MSVIFHNKVVGAKIAWVLETEIRFPIDSKVDPLFIYIASASFVFRISMLLETLFAIKQPKRRRSIEGDQYQIFKSIESALAVMGVDGRSCLLRTICEMQKNPIGEMTMIGEIITALLT
ncbi:uncharacterized protein LOC136025548 [Artemia franciscana]|uniref:Uncharacterized protein n=1 Tax=Artemia franciscana TaxID=6661 RepID=A0AA88HUP5_ARTSF|nr:hypothetical protein QYM36_011183 [Artemia franciscana]